MTEPRRDRTAGGVVRGHRPASPSAVRPRRLPRDAFLELPARHAAQPGLFAERRSPAPDLTGLDPSR